MLSVLCEKEHLALIRDPYTSMFVSFMKSQLKNVRLVDMFQ